MKMFEILISLKNSLVFFRCESAKVSAYENGGVGRAGAFGQSTEHQSTSAVGQKNEQLSSF